MPSYILAAPSSLDRPAAGYVEYVRGDRSDLIGCAWLAGEAAYEQSPSGYDAVNRDTLGKLNKALQMLLGLLSYHAPHSLDVELVCSIHLIELADEVSARLNGSHTVRYNDSDTEHTINVKVLKVCPEGFGAVLEHNLTQGKSVVVDLGNGTTITTIYGKRGRIIERDVKDGGFEDLISRIARDSDLVLELGTQGNPDRIRRGIEDGSYQYARTGVSLLPYVKKHLAPWFEAAINGALSFAREHKADAEQAIAIGGGATLKPVKSCFEKHGLGVAPDPVFCSAKGLYKLTQRQAAQA